MPAARLLPAAVDDARLRGDVERRDATRSTGFEWFIVALAFFVDLASYASGRHGRASAPLQPILPCERGQERRARDSAALGDRVEQAIEERVDAEREIERGEAERRAAGAEPAADDFWLAVTGISLYLVAPSLLDVLGSWRDLERIDWFWFPAMRCFRRAGWRACGRCSGWRCTGPRWPDVIESQLAGNALAKIAPAGGAVGAALQYRMLVEAGLERGRTVAGITAVNLLTFAVVLALPVLALPALLRRLGRPQPDRGDADRGGRVRAPARRRGRPARLRPAAGAGRPRGASRAQPPAARGSSRCGPARAAAARARQAARDPGAELAAGGGGDRRPLGVRLRDPAGRAGGGRLDARARRSCCSPSAPRRCWRRSRSPRAGSASSRRG